MILFADSSCRGQCCLGFFWHGHFIMVTFRQRDILAQERFGMGIFCHFPKCRCAETSMCQNILVPKCPRAITSLCPWCWNISMPKCSRAKLSSCQKVPVMKFLCPNISCWNIRCRNKSKPNDYWAMLVTPVFQVEFSGICAGWFHE